MQRRHLLGLLGVAGLGAAATGYWHLPLAAAPAALTLPAAMQLLERLVQASLHSVAGWPPAMVFNHCAQSVDYSIDGYPQLKPAWFRHTAGPLAFSVFAARGAMRHPLDEAIPGAPELNEPGEVRVALARLQLAFARFAAHRGPLAAHFAYGELSHDEYALAHVLHLYNHLALLRANGQPIA